MTFTKSLAVMMLSIALSAGALSTHASERVYKWTDENGTVHFGQQPPTTKQSQAIDVKSGYSAEAKKTDAEMSAEAEERSKYCKLAQSNLEALTSGGEVQRKDDYGNVTTMTPEEIEAERGKAEDAVKRYCGEEAADD